MTHGRSDPPREHSDPTAQRLLLDLACAPQTLAFWETACDLLFNEIPFQLATVWSRGAATVLTLQADGSFKKMPDSDAAAQDLRVGSVYNYSGHTLQSGVVHIDVNGLRRTPQHRHGLLKVHGCDDLIAIVLLSGDDWVCADIALYRNADDRKAVPEAAARLRTLYPALERVVLHHWRFAQQESFQTGVIDFLRDLPVGLAFFSWEQRLLYANDEAYRQSHVWNSAPNVRPLNHAELRRVFKAAPELHQACWILRYGRTLSLARLEPMERTQLVVSHPRVPHLKAVVGITMDAHQPFRTPNFVVRFGGLTLASASDAFEPTSKQLSALAELTPAERAVAVLAMRGLDNQRIAVQLNRAVSTVKDHLTRIYAKLGVKSRAQLAGLKGS